MSGKVIKMITSNVQEYFKTNKITSGISIPTSGTFVKGDIIVNNGTTQDTKPMWLCVESGSPGRWIVVGKVQDLPQDLLDKVAGIGEIVNLTTEDKSSIVAAINELNTNKMDTVTISNSTSSASEVDVASSKAVKLTMDKADEAKTLADNNKTTISSLNTKTDVTNTNLNNLKTKVDNGQNHKVTGDKGTSIDIIGQDLNNLNKNGSYVGNNLINSPDGLNNWWFVEVLEHIHTNGYTYQRATKMTQFDSNNKYERLCIGGNWQPWRSL